MPHHDTAKNGGEGRVSPVAVQKGLKGINYPASKDDLIKQAQSNEAPDEVIAKIRQLPGDRFGGPQEVMRALGQIE
jgi:hypothetical protein